MVEQHNIEFIYDTLSTIRAPFVSLEAEIYAIIEEVLKKNKVIYHREHVLGKKKRIDFFTSSGVGIEVKKGKPNNTQLIRQIAKYCEHESLKGLIIVTPWSRHLNVPHAIHEKPVKVLCLNRLWGIAI